MALKTVVFHDASSFRAWLIGERRGASHVGHGSAPRWSGLAEDALVRKSLSKVLHAEVVVPRLREAHMLLMQLSEVHVVAAKDVPAPQFDGNVMAS